MRLKNGKTLGLGALAAGIAGMAGLMLPAGAGQAQSSSAWYVHTNCSVSPCTMGVAQHPYAQPGNARYLEGWRRRSQSYPTSDRAWQTACRWHYGNPSMSSPAIANGSFSCSSVCSNGTCQ